MLIRWAHYQYNGHLKKQPLKLKTFKIFNLEWIEELLHPSNLMEYKKLCKVSKIPIAMGGIFRVMMRVLNCIQQLR